MTSTDDALYGLDALPYGVFDPGQGPRVGVRFGPGVVDLAALSAAAHSPLVELFDQPSLDAFLAAGRTVWSQARSKVQEWLSTTPSEHGHRLADVDLHQPFTVADYVDFYSSRVHAENLSQIFRPGQPPLQQNWLSLPVGYHGRAGTIVPSGTPVVRPNGQRAGAGAGPSEFGPTRKLDLEVELGFVVGRGSTLGTPVPGGDAREHIFGVVLVDDWSARDIQAFEYVPLGPMLGKSFATSIGHWVLPIEALDAARIPPPPREQALHPYLTGWNDMGLDIDFEVRLNGHLISAPRYRDVYWTPEQQLAHLTISGASLRSGDLFASGTVSSIGNPGSLIELTLDGRRQLALPDGRQRTYLEDGDEVVITATAPGPGVARIGLGEVRGTIYPSPIEQEDN
ncbi:fumarylacetoacetase [Acrocarpospora pleiomorpha]|uniref:fumarylacetoacetase n=1 Tax=Acrocarpospora pleiomorpha TaxID=90975 RepID=A0A5M3XT33_9ACTN|nr:fumarylacetoacetate hydrolase family protein [Acrocarpospora pleiomorpha]GES24385.1 fumarylacetoacetase [Acrocarpospora pleiomorpha]